MDIISNDCYQGNMQLRVKVVPNASHSEWIGWEDDPIVGRVARIRVAAPPVDGKANAALTKFLAKYLGVPKSKIRLIKGEVSRIKTFEVPDGAMEI